MLSNLVLSILLKPVQLPCIEFFAVEKPAVRRLRVIHIHYVAVMSGSTFTRVANGRSSHISGWTKNYQAADSLPSVCIPIKHVISLVALYFFLICLPTSIKPGSSHQIISSKHNNIARGSITPLSSRYTAEASNKGSSLKGHKVLIASKSTEQGGENDTDNSGNAAELHNRSEHSGTTRKTSGNKKTNKPQKVGSMSPDDLEDAESASASEVGTFSHLVSEVETSSSVNGLNGDAPSDWDNDVETEEGNSKYDDSAGIRNYPSQEGEVPSEADDGTAATLSVNSKEGCHFTSCSACKGMLFNEVIQEFSSNYLGDTVCLQAITKVMCGLNCAEAPPACVSLSGTSQRSSDKLTIPLCESECKVLQEACSSQDHETRSHNQRALLRSLHKARNQGQFLECGAFILNDTQSASSEPSKSREAQRNNLDSELSSCWHFFVPILKLRKSVEISTSLASKDKSCMTLSLTEVSDNSTDAGALSSLERTGETATDSLPTDDSEAFSKISSRKNDHRFQRDLNPGNAAFIDSSASASNLDNNFQNSSLNGQTLPLNSQRSRIASSGENMTENSPNDALPKSSLLHVDTASHAAQFYPIPPPVYPSGSIVLAPQTLKNQELARVLNTITLTPQQQLILQNYPFNGVPRPEVTFCVISCVCLTYTLLGTAIFILQLSASAFAAYLHSRLFSQGVFSLSFFQGGGIHMIIAFLTGSLVGGLTMHFKFHCLGASLGMAGCMAALATSSTLVGRRGAWLGAIGGTGVGCLTGFFIQYNFLMLAMGGAIGLIFGLVIGFFPFARKLKMNDRYIRRGLAGAEASGEHRRSSLDSISGVRRISSGKSVSSDRESASERDRTAPGEAGKRRTSERRR